MRWVSVALHLLSTLQPNKVVCIDNHEEPSATPEADEVHSTPKGSTPVESLATDADGYHLDAQVSGSSLSSGWRGSLSQQLPQANPTCLVQENEVEMIYINPFRMESPY
ncbi:hypothetical protein POTOM_019250 [Populus tomentosa]|uniref:Uncharacterized protein n=1 Tax=Populus tomentosa TaxID=118781 RepID=A0A8X7ZUA1_POPTO|nr:hypothetical protein POTOM_019250 [Populus tomentosa]